MKKYWQLNKKEYNHTYIGV